MATITLKNLPRGLHRELKNRAKEHHRSLNKEVIVTLQSATGTVPRLDTDAMMREARQARSRFKRLITAKEISAWKRYGRL